MIHKILWFSLEILYAFHLVLTYTSIILSCMWCCSAYMCIIEKLSAMIVAIHSLLLFYMNLPITLVKYPNSWPFDKKKLLLNLCWYNLLHLKLKISVFWQKKLQSIFMCSARPLHSRPHQADHVVHLTKLVRNKI